jgi:hypothetical protein
MPIRLIRVSIPPRAGAVARIVTLAAIVSLLVAACSGAPGGPGSTFSPIPPGDGSGVPASPTPSSPPASPTATASGILLEVTTEGGFINPVATIGALPLVLVDAGGRIFTPAAAPGGPTLIPAVDVRDTGAAGAAAIRAAMRAAGLETAGASGGMVPDAGTTVFTAMVDGAEVVNRVSGAGPGGPVGGPGQPGGSDGSPGGPGSSGAAALALLARLADLAQPWGAPAAPAVTRLAPSAYRVWVAPAPDQMAGAASVAWPIAGDPSTFGAPAAADFGVTGLRSGIVAGPDAAALGAALATAAPGTLLTASGRAWQAWVRPLLPAENGG